MVAHARAIGDEVSRVNGRVVGDVNGGGVLSRQSEYYLF